MVISSPRIHPALKNQPHQSKHNNLPEYIYKSALYKTNATYAFYFS